MIASTLKELIQQKYGKDNIARVVNRKVEVTFKPGDKVYRYNGSVYSVAERLKLIPEIDIVAESRQIIESLKAQASVVAPSGCGDTCRMSNSAVSERYNIGLDKFDRELSEYTLDHSNKWI